MADKGSFSILCLISGLPSYSSTVSSSSVKFDGIAILWGYAKPSPPTMEGYLCSPNPVTHNYVKLLNTLSILLTLREKELHSSILDTTELTVA